VRRPDLRPNPFQGEHDFVHVELERLFDAIDDVQREHKDGRKEGNFDLHCDRAIAILESMKTKGRS
jgi:hypothetical protein